METLFLMVRLQLEAVAVNRRTTGCNHCDRWGAAAIRMKGFLCEASLLCGNKVRWLCEEMVRPAR